MLKTGGALGLFCAAVFTFSSCHEGASPHGPPTPGAGAGSPTPPPSLVAGPADERSGDHRQDAASLARADTEARRLIKRGLEYLAQHQNADGSFGGAEASSVRLGLSAIATMAFIAHGDTEFRGRYHPTTSKAIKFLMACSERDGERKGFIQANGDLKSRMHGHGYATLALTQAHGMFGVQREFSSSAANLKEIIKDAVDVIVRSQSLDGGWDYEPFNRVADEGSITVCMIQALRGARNAGFHVPPRTVTKATDYIRRSQKKDGSIRYSLNGDLKSTFELTAAGAATLIHAGEYYEKSLQAANDFLWERRLESFLAAEHSFPFYGLFYAAQVLHLDYGDPSGRRLRRAYPQIVGWYTERFNEKTGVYQEFSRNNHGEVEFGPVYRSAFATLALLIRHGYLPIFQR